MKDIIEYAEKELRRFDEKPFNSVDSLILSQFAYFNFDGLVPGPEDNSPPVRIGDLYKAEFFSSMINDLLYIDKNRRLFFAMAASPRFRDTKLNYYVNKLDYESEKQFSAVTFFLPDGTSFVAYRGTDLSFVGWKEDFNMVYKSPIPSQEEGVEYLNTVAGKTTGSLMVGGHSKGGNLAVYSSMYCNKPARDRIIAVYSHDGPGFREEVFQSSAFMEINNRIHKIIPQYSIIGMLLQVQENYHVVESKRFWIMQHDPFSWVIEKGDFKYTKSVANSSLNVNYTISAEKRELFIDALYHVINSTNAKSVSDLSQLRIRDFAAVLRAFRSIDSEIRKFVIQTLRELIVLYVKNLRPMSRKAITPASEASAKAGDLQTVNGSAK
jgi:hypothetical protein